MFEPPILNQLLGTGAVILGFISAGILAHNLEKQEQIKKQEQLKHDTDIIKASQEAYIRGREAEWQEIRKNIRREFQGFTFDNERPVGLRPEPLALPEPRRVRYAKFLG